LGIVQLGDRMGNNEIRSLYPSQLTGITNDEIKTSREDVFNIYVALIIMIYSI
jgi:hypothetical protein